VLFLELFVLWIAFSTVDRLTFSRLEWYFTFLLTVATYCFMHFSWAEISWASISKSFIISHCCLHLVYWFISVVLQLYPLEREFICILCRYLVFLVFKCTYSQFIDHFPLFLLRKCYLGNTIRSHLCTKLP